MKPGHKTTEFAFLVVFTVLELIAVATGFIKDPGIGGVAVGVVGAAYAIARGLAKQHNVEPPPGADKPPV